MSPGEPDDGLAGWTRSEQNCARPEPHDEFWQRAPSCVVDIHAHILTDSMVAELTVQVPEVPLSYQADPGTGERVLVVGGERFAPAPDGLSDIAQRLRQMDDAGIDLQVLSHAPYVHAYGLPPTIAPRWARALNDGLDAVVASHSDRFLGFAALPMQAPAAACDEVARIVGKPRLRGVCVGTNIAGRMLGDPAFDDVWGELERHQLLVFVHPVGVLAQALSLPFGLANFAGYPLDTTVAAASLVFSGVLARHPAIRFCLAHGGGFLPYQRGRLIHGYRSRHSGRPDPAADFGKFYFDALLHDPRAVDHLLAVAGPDHVLLGSDHPFDMGLEQPLAELRKSVPASDPRYPGIAGRTALQLLGIPSE
jgi:aminocarboxymuconate-semialdehyde decarboxylase